MKRLIMLLVVSLVIVLSGCGEDSQYTEPPQDDWPHTVKYAFCSKNGNYSEPYCVEFWTEYDLNEGRDLEHYYTQEEVDELLYIIEHWSEMTDVALDDIYEEIDELEQRIEALESNQDVVVYGNCDYTDIGSLINDIIEAYEQGYTLQKDNLGDEWLEFKDGVFTGDVFTPRLLLEQYCTVD